MRISLRSVLAFSAIEEGSGEAIARLIIAGKSMRRLANSPGALRRSVSGYSPLGIEA